MSKYLKTHKINLLFIAGIVWGIAGFNVLRIGIVAYKPYFTILNFMISFVIYGVFQIFVFGKMVKKHTKRITQYKEERQYLYKFFDLKGFCIMAFMMTFGIGLRVSGICPERFIAVFYSGLGASLCTAGIMFIVNYIRAYKERTVEK